MKKKLQTIYEYFKEYEKEEIDEMIKSLNSEEKIIIEARYGKDLYNPKTSEKWNKELSEKFYGTLIPKMKRILKNNKTSKNEKEENNKNISISKSNIEKINIYPHVILEEIKKGKSNTEICNKFNITSDILYASLLNLQNNGIDFLRKYYSDGSIYYKPVSTMIDFKKVKQITQEKIIITDVKETDMKFLVISDLHFGNANDRLDLINRAFNYCAKNGINNILCGGDFIDGTFTHGEQKISDVYNQIEFFIKNYPSDKNIITYGVGGDHDYSAFAKNYLNLIEICNNLRHDIVIGGFNNTNIGIKNDFIHLYHYLVNGEISQIKAPIILHGHSHKYATSIVNDILNVTIPSLSNIVTDMPTALELNISFNKGYMKTVIIKQIYFGDKDIILNEQTHDLLKNRIINYIPTKNIENYKPSNETETKILKKVVTQK